MEKVTLINTVPQEVLDALKLDKARQRYLYFTDKLPKENFHDAGYAIEENRIYYSESTITLRMGASLYLYRTHKKGFSYNKTTNEFVMWFGSSIDKLTYLKLFLSAIGKEWIINEKFVVGIWVTKTFMRKVLSDKITNPKLACKFLIQQYRLKCSPEILRLFIKRGGDKILVLSVKDVALNLDRFLSKDMNNIYVSSDIVKQAKALGRTIDFSWSLKRLEQEHELWTQELMAMEVQDMEDVQIKWPKIKLPDGFELITSKRRLFEEGTKMHHCIFTNYWERARSKRYMVLHVTDTMGNEATAGIVVNETLKLDAVLSKYNKPASPQIVSSVKRLIRNEEFIKKICKKTIIQR